MNIFCLFYAFQHVPLGNGFICYHICQQLFTYIPECKLLYIHLGDAYTLSSTTPIFVTVFACLCLQERFGLFEVANIFFTLLGIILVFRPPFLFGAAATTTSSAQVDYLSYSLVLVGSLFNAGSIIGTRALKVPNSICKFLANLSQLHVRLWTHFLFPPGLASPARSLHSFTSSPMAQPGYPAGLT